MEKVQKPTWNGDYIQWNDVANESGYTIYVYKNGNLVFSIGTGADVTSNLISLRLVNEGFGTYTITLQANGTGLYSDGHESEASEPYVVSES